MPENAVYVGRGSRWGNPCIMRDESDRADAVAWFEAHVAPKVDVAELRGKDLACWCPLDQPCHADVLLEIANAPVSDKLTGGSDE
jgi:hypothetical protein